MMWVVALSDLRGRRHDWRAACGTTGDFVLHIRCFSSRTPNVIIAAWCSDFEGMT